MPWRMETQPDTDWQNIFQLWDENGRQLPFRAAKKTWSAEAGHYLIVERIEVGNWPLGKAWGQITGTACRETRRADQAVWYLYLVQNILNPIRSH